MSMFKNRNSKVQKGRPFLALFALSVLFASTVWEQKANLHESLCHLNLSGNAADASQSIYKTEKINDKEGNDSSQKSSPCTECVPTHLCRICSCSVICLGAQPSFEGINQEIKLDHRLGLVFSSDHYSRLFRPPIA